jgi:hypothetical protein
MWDSGNELLTGNESKQFLDSNPFLKSWSIILLAY